MKFVQFSDEKKTAVISVFSCLQNSDEYPNQDEIDADDERLLSYIDALPEAFRQSVSSM